MAVEMGSEVTGLCPTLGVSMVLNYIHHTCPHGANSNWDGRLPQLP